MSENPIVLKNVSVHNLRKVSLTLQPKELIVLTGVSGSGKSSLAFDTIYMEGQRRYVESLSPYARRHLGDFPKPEAEGIEGISPTVAIEQKTIGKNPRSTVGTLTGIYDYLRVLFAKLAVPYCPVSKEPVSPQSEQEILDTLLRLPEGTKLLLLSPVASQKKGSFLEEFTDLRKKGFARVRVDGSIYDLEEIPPQDPSSPHDVEVVIDRLVISEENRTRLTEAVHTALEVGKGIVRTLEPESEKEALFSLHARCRKSGISYPPLDPRDFSFNHPSGMCPHCEGLRVSAEFDLSKIIDPEKSLSEDCCIVAGSYTTLRYGNIYDNLAKMYKSSVTAPWKTLPKQLQHVFLYGAKEPRIRIRFTHPKKGTWIENIEWKGVLYEAKSRYRAATSESYKNNLRPYLIETTCPECLGSGLKPYPSHARFHKKTIAEITGLTVQEAIPFFATIPLSDQQRIIGGELLQEISERLSFLEKVGLSYLSLDRAAPGLSGGEGQRVRLASQIGSGLIGATYILDEPSIGLHPRDNKKLLDTLLDLKNKGNTVIVVEHDEETIRAADTVVDIGPLAGKNGGEIVFAGSIAGLLSCKESLTGQYLRRELTIPDSEKRKPKKKEGIVLSGASCHNLQNVTLTVPLGLLIAVTGVSGSGKSSLISDTLYPVLSNRVNGSDLPSGPYTKITGTERIDKVIAVDQSPIGKTPRSNPATYVKVFDEIRDLFATLPSSLAAGFTPGRFSFNVKEGCCPTCSGMGMVKVDMDFLSDEWSLCETCGGKRFDEATLSIRFKGKTILDVLEMTIGEASEFFSAQPKIRSKLETLVAVGLDYIQLGQPSPSLSGGEAQRIKLAKELARPSSGKTVYILDEPTTGLHFHDIAHLTRILLSLVKKGNTVIVIEHNIDLIRAADRIIDIGPEAGKFGGTIVGEGSPEEISRMNTATGNALREALRGQPISLISEKPTISTKRPELIVRGARQNNLQGIDVTIPLQAITVCTGPSGSGKSSFAFETLYAEGQRRYIESMSRYARQFVKQMPKPKVDSIEGLSAAIAVEQKQHPGNARSTVGTLSETYDYLRVFYAVVGTPFCPETGEEIRSIDKNTVVEKALSLPENGKCFVLAPVTVPKQESFDRFREKLLRQGFVRIRLNGTFYELEETDIPWDPKRKNSVFVVVDRLLIEKTNRSRLFEAVEAALSLTKDLVTIATETEDFPFYLASGVQSTGKSYPPVTTHTFSFNTEIGMCPDCKGLGSEYGAGRLFTEKLFSLSPYDLFFLLCKEHVSRSSLKQFLQVLSEVGIDPHTPIGSLTRDSLTIFLYGNKEESPSNRPVWIGMATVLERYAKSSKGNFRSILGILLEKHVCHSCEGTRLSPLARNVKIGEISIADLIREPIDRISNFLENVPLTEEQKRLTKECLAALLSGLRLLQRLGLGYLSLHRSAPDLSGGETQRIRLARQLSSGLSGCLYVLDEPSIGLHPHDTDRVNEALLQLKALGNTLILVEHDPRTVRIADYLLDFGPGAGRLGGKLLAKGTLEEIRSDPSSITGAYLSGRKRILVAQKRRKPKGNIILRDVRIHNLDHKEISLPIGVLCVITGVSGAGKSTLAWDVLRPAAEKFLLAKKTKNREFAPDTVSGLEAFDKLIALDQDPTGKTGRADIATYTELLTPLRQLFASLPEAKARGLQGKHFSYNHKKGMCSSCFGLGTKTVALQFLPSVKVECESCKGNRLNPLSLEVRFKGKHFGEVLSLSVEEAMSFFAAFPKILKKLEVLASIGLSYLNLGRDIASLSGGESQRLRLGCELMKRSTGNTLYLFDEPSIGLHASDIEKLLPIFHSLVEKGNTVFLIDHHEDIMAEADYLIDLGPGAGPAGGKIVCEGTPEEVALHPESKTAPFLKETLEARSRYRPEK